MSRGWRDDEAGDQADPARLSHLLDHWLASEGLTDLKVLNRVRESWPGLVGEDMAIHAAPVSLQEGTLVVAVDHSAWATELKFLQKRIQRSLESQLGVGVMTRLEVRVRHTDGVE